jgi:hypothetical protein
MDCTNSPTGYAKPDAMKVAGKPTYGWASHMSGSLVVGLPVPENRA